MYPNKSFVKWWKISILIIDWEKNVKIILFWFPPSTLCTSTVGVGRGSRSCPGDVSGTWDCPPPRSPGCRGGTTQPGSSSCSRGTLAQPRPSNQLARLCGENPWIMINTNKYTFFNFCSLTSNVHKLTVHQCNSDGKASCTKIAKIWAF